MEISFEFDMYSVSEELGSVSVCIVRSGDTSMAVEVALQTSPLTAQGKCDWIWENPTFCRFHQNLKFASTYNDV